jgi:hypothetical protein
MARMEMQQNPPNTENNTKNFFLQPMKAHINPATDGLMINGILTSMIRNSSQTNKKDRLQSHAQRSH